MMTSFRMYYTLCPQSEIFELATVMKERLLGDFSRKISILITFSIKFSIPRNLSTKLLDSEKFLENSSRFREDDIYKYRVLWLCSSVAEPRELMTKEELKNQKVSIRREEEDAMSSLLAQRHKLLFRAKVIL